MKFSQSLLKFVRQQMWTKQDSEEQPQQPITHLHNTILYYAIRIA
jgi:hypothetical protein